MARLLKGKPAFKRLATNIDQTATAQSCAADLAQAQSSVDALVAFLASPRKRGTLERSAMEQALLRTATELYARAVALPGKKGERGSISIRARLSPAEAEDHDAIFAVRNRAFAHVYASETVDDEAWHEDLLFAFELAGAWLPAGLTRAVQFNRRLLERLERQMPIARRLVIDRYHANLSKVVAELSHNVPTQLFLDAGFDPILVFGSEAAARHVAEGRHGDEKTMLAHGPPRGGM